MITNPTLGDLASETGVGFFQSFFGNVIGLALVAGSVIFLFMMIMGAIAWMSSGSDKGAVEGARSKVTNGLIGIVILFSVFAIVTLVSYFFGDLNLLEPTLTPVTP